MRSNADEIDPEFEAAEEALRLAKVEMEQLDADRLEKEKKDFVNSIEDHLEQVPQKPENNDAIEKESETPEKKGFSNLEDLSFVRLIDPVHIPSYLVEQIKSRVFNIEKFYSYLKILCTYRSDSGPILNNTVFLYAITNVKLRQVKGFLFLYLDPLTNSLVISQFSIDKEYWNKGEGVNFMLSYAKQMMKELSASRIVWLTKNVKTCESLGFTRSRETLMSFEGK